MTAADWVANTVSVQSHGKGHHGKSRAGQEDCQRTARDKPCPLPSPSGWKGNLPQELACKKLTRLPTKPQRPSAFKGSALQPTLKQGITHEEFVVGGSRRWYWQFDLARSRPGGVAAGLQVDALEGLFGKHTGSRRSGAKGLCASGYFVGNTVGRTLSSAAVFNGDKVPVVARFSLGGGNAKASDKSRSVRGLALQFNLPDGEQWAMANISAPVFFVARPDQFAPFLQARTPDPATGKPDAAKLKAFNDANPETLLQAAYLTKAPIPAGYGAVNYWSTNAFEFVNAKGASQFVRWQFMPEQGTLGLTEDQLKTLPDDFWRTSCANVWRWPPWLSALACSLHRVAMC